MSPEGVPRCTAREIAEALGVTERSVRRLASRESWPFKEEPTRGGRRRAYHLDGISPPFRVAVFRARAAAEAPPSAEPHCPKRSAEIWRRAEAVHW